jgi:hypothetical protein
LRASACACRRTRLGSGDRDRQATRRLAALRDVQHEHDGAPVSAGQIAAACPAPWQRRPDLVTQALVLVAAGSTRAWKITAAGRLMLAPRRGPARQRPVIGGRPRLR